MRFNEGILSYENNTLKAALLNFLLKKNRPMPINDYESPIGKSLIHLFHC